MNLKELVLRKASYFLIIIFFILINQSGFTQTDQSEKEKRGLELIEEGRRLYIVDGNYCESINKYKEAEVLLRARPNLSKLYIERSKSEYAINRDCETGEEIDKETRERITAEWIEKALDKYCQISKYIKENEQLFTKKWRNIFNELYNEYMNRDIGLDLFSFSFSGKEGGANPSSQTFRVRNSGRGILNFQVQTDKGWIKVDRDGDEATNDWNEVTVSVDISDLARGDYNGTIAISSDCARNSPQRVTINLKILPPPKPKIELDKKLLIFELIKDKISPSSQVFRIRNAVEGKLDYQISSDTYWINVYPKWGSSTGDWEPITVSVNASKLSKLREGEYEYKGILTVTSDYSTNSPQEIKVNIKIKPAIELDKTNIDFKLIKGKKEQASQIFMVRNPIRGILDYQIGSDTSWINVYPKWGSSTGNRDSIELKVDSTNLGKGEYRGTITIKSDYAINSPQKVNVYLNVTKPYVRPIQFTLGFYGGYYLPKDKIFKQIYGKESLLGGMEISFPLFLRVFDVWINSNYITTNGKSTHTEESSKLTIIPFSLGIRLLVNLKFLIPFLGAGMNYYIYSEEYEEDIYESTKGSTFGLHMQGGIYFKLAKSFLFKLFIKYNDVKTRENNININLGGMEYGGGIVFNF